MGSFNKIGFISSLPITAGDETTLIFLKPNKYAEKGGITYSTDWYEHLTYDWCRFKKYSFD